MPAPPSEPANVLVCPDCTKRHPDTLARIGNRKDECKRCNRFAQAVRRTVARLLVERHADEAASLRPGVEAEVYKWIIDGRRKPRRKTARPRLPAPGSIPPPEPDPTLFVLKEPRPRRRCSIEGCERVHRARGYCSMHYKRWQDTGDPLKASRFDTQAEKDAHMRAEWERTHPDSSRPAPPALPPHTDGQPLGSTDRAPVYGRKREDTP